MSTEALRVANQTDPSKLAAAMSAILKRGEPTDLLAIGAAAVGIAVEGVALARGLLIHYRLVPVLTPSFGTMDTDDGERTFMRLAVHGEPLP